MENKKYSEIIEELRFTSNKLEDILNRVNFYSLERRKIRGNTGYFRHQSPWNGGV